MARSYPTHEWVPAKLVEQLQLRLRDSKRSPPVGINAENGRRFFYNSSQLDCPHDELKRRVAELLATPRYGAVDCGPSAEVPPLNTNGEPFPPAFVREVMARFRREDDSAARSRYWATVQEAEHVFNSPFEPSFLTEKNAIVLRGCSLCHRAVYYNVCGTRRPEAFNSETCRRYEPHNFCGRRYSPVVALHMKASAIRHGCMNSLMWLTTRRVARSHVGLRSGVKPLTMCVESVFYLVNVAMTDNPTVLQNKMLSRMPHDPTDDDILTFPP